MDADAAGAAGVGRAGLLGVAITLDAGNGEQQVVPVADSQRQVGDLAARHDGVERRCLRVEQRRRGLHGHGFGDAAGRQRQVDAAALAGGQHDQLRGGLEARRGGFDQILAGGEIDDEPGAVLGRDGGPAHPGGVAGHGDGSAGHDGVAGVADHAGERGAIDLRECR